jgi:serine phosphatase RsbU (regulator of sigma subunit)
MKKTNKIGLYDRGTLWVILVACISIALAMLVTGSLSYSITEKAVIEKLKSKDLFFMVDSAAGKIDGRIARAKETSLILAQDPFMRAWVEKGERDSEQRELALEKLKQIASDYDYSSTFLASARTKTYWTEGQLIGKLSETNPQDEWFFQTLSSKIPVAVNIDYNKERNNTFVFVNALMGDPSNPLGVAGVGLDLEDISTEFSSYRSGEMGKIWLIDREGKIHLAANIEDRGKFIHDVLPPAICDQILAKNISSHESSHGIEYVNKSGELIDLVHQPLESSEWQLIVQVPRSDTIGLLASIKSNTLMAALIALLLITLIFYLISTRIANPLRRALQLSEELEQKVNERTHELKEQNLKIMDSIHYAQKVQETIIPSEEELKDALPESFVLWQPRDIVGGDFYWLRKQPDRTILVVADCTGHGVPGALMSMAVAPILDDLVKQESLSPAGLITALNARLRAALHKRRTPMTDDGLDLGVCFMTQETITFSGAKIDLYHKDLEGVQRIRGDRKSIGYTKSDMNYSFTDTVLQMKPTDSFYITTDGFLDQNGRENDASFGRSRFVDLIEQNWERRFEEQRTLFYHTLTQYQEDEPQRDDITVIGFKGMLRE